MTQTAVSSNGHTKAFGNADLPEAQARDAVVSGERRQTATEPSVSPERLVERHVENARRQLAEARERLKAARRRVVQLEDALGNWERFAAELRRGRQKGAPGA